MPDGYLLKPETAEGLLGLLRDNSGRAKLGNDHSGIMGRIEHVKCVSLISSSPFPHYLATVELISDLTTSTSSTGNVVLASLAQGTLTTGRTYNGVLSGGKVVSGETLPIYWCDTAAGFYAKLTGGTGPYSWLECTVSGGAVTDARTGTLNATEATTGLTGIPADNSVIVWMSGSGSSYSFNAKMFTLITSWTFSGTGSSCTIVPATTKTIVISGANLCGSTT